MSIVTGLISRGGHAFEKITYREWLIGMALAGIAQRPGICYSEEECAFAAKWAVALANTTIATIDNKEYFSNKPVEPDISH